MSSGRSRREILPLYDCESLLSSNSEPGCSSSSKSGSHWHRDGSSVKSRSSNGGVDEDGDDIDDAVERGAGSTKHATRFSYPFGRSIHSHS